MIVLSFFVITASFTVYVMSPSNSCAVPKHFPWCPRDVPFCGVPKMMSLPVHKHTNTCHSEKINCSACKQASVTKNKKLSKSIPLPVLRHTSSLLGVNSLCTNIFLWQIRCVLPGKINIEIPRFPLPLYRGHPESGRLSIGQQLIRLPVHACNLNQVSSLL